MQSLVAVIMWILVGLFTLTGVVTLLSITRIGKSTQLITVDEKYRNTLFRTLLLEIVALVLTLGWFGVDIVKDSSRKEKEISQWKVSVEEWVSASQSWIKEPSGLCKSDLRGSDIRRAPFALAVDDDEPDIFVIGSIMEELGVVKTLSFDKYEPNDLEAICWDETKWYYAATSHRCIAGGYDLTRMLLRFIIDPRRWRDPEYELVPESRDISEVLYDYLKDSCGVLVDRELWSGKSIPKPQWHPYALEIEGLTFRNGNLLIGLKWPLSDKDNAILVAYNWETNAITDHSMLDLNGKGISALSYDSEKNTLIVIANPPEKERTNDKQDYKMYLGESVGYVFNWPVNLDEPSFSHKMAGVAYPNSKLEGIAQVAEDELWLAYDGPEHLLAKTSASNIHLYPGDK